MKTVEKLIENSAAHEESDFGKGLSYCLGLFLAHAERSRDGLGPDIWFNGSSDHLYDLQIEAAPEELRDRLREFQDRALHFGHGFREPFPTHQDIVASIEEAKQLLLLIDRATGIPAIQANYS